MSARRLRNVTDEQLAEALRQNAGIKLKAAKACRISRQSVQDRVDKSPALQNVIRQIKQELLDLGESTILRGVKRGDKDWTKLYMTQQGKDRGYGNRVDVGIDDATAEAIVAGLGGSIEAFRAALRQLGVPASEIP